MALWELDSQLLQLSRSFNEHKCETSFHMPLDMAMEQRDARIINFEADHRVPVPVDQNGVSPHRGGWSFF
jgi:hypothetical protein